MLKCKRKKLAKGFIWCLIKSRYEAREFNWYYQWHNLVHKNDW